jgi:hypothetical protein
MWAVNALEFRRFQGRGEPFTEVMDALISSEMPIAGIPDSALSTNLRVTIPDGGIDTRLAVAIPASPTGWSEPGPVGSIRLSPMQTLAMLISKKKFQRTTQPI